MFLVDAFTYVFFPVGDKRFSKSFQGYLLGASRADAGNGVTAKSVKIVAKL